VTYSWTGPDNFSSTLETPEVSKPGVYSVTAKNPDNQCTSTAAVTVNQNIDQPGATASVASRLTCKVISTKLSASSQASDVTYHWTGPAGFTPTIVQNPIATKGGDYELTVTKVSNGCKSTAVVNVLQDIARPGVSADSSGQLNCRDSQVSVLATSPLSTATYKWIGPSGYSSTEQNPIVSTPGGYTVTATNPDNGCTSTNVTRVNRNIAAPAGVTVAASGPLNCLTKTVKLTATAATTGVTYSWSGPGAITDPEAAEATVSTPGVYTVTVTNPVNGCTSTATVTVEQNTDVPADVVITASGTLTCTTTSVTLKGSSTTGGVNYRWSGPGVINNPTLAEISVSTPGTYTLTVTNPVNACEVQQTVTVVQDIVAPENVTATASGILTCTKQSIDLTGFSSTSGVRYSWSGPGTITNPSEAVASVTTRGIYTLTVTNPVNGCKTVKTVEVFENTTVPANLTATAPGTLTCTAPGVKLSANSPTPALTYRWTGPNGFTSTDQYPEVTGAGDYTVVATNTANGCTSTASVTVFEDKVAPGVSASVSPGTITCNTPRVTMTAASTTSGILYSWTGPENYTSSESNPTTTVGGLYTVVVTNPLNGCTSTSSVNVLQNNVKPVNVSASVSGVITCSETSVILEGQSSTPDVNYRWAGPDGFTSSLRDPETDREGVYVLTVTDPANGCKVTSNVTVEKDIETPQGVTATTPDILTCTLTSVTLNGTSTTQGVSYSWTGPGEIVNPASATPTVSIPGTYELTVRNTRNNCTATATVTVEQNATEPEGVTATVSGLITCTRTDVLVTGNSTTGGVTYTWEGPNNFRSNEKSFRTNVPGTYTVTVKHQVSGCIKTASILVEENKTLPDNVAATTSGDLTCAVSSVELRGTSSTNDATYSWSGPGAISNPTSANPNVSVHGTYTVTAAHPVSGCTSSATVTVRENKTVPSDVTAIASGNITCTKSSVKLTAASETSGVTYSWTGPGTITDPSSATQNVSTIGTYTVTVTHPISHCTETATVTVHEDKENPDASASVSGPLTCTISSVSLIGQSSTPDAIYRWSGTGTITDPSSATASVTSIGDYLLTVTNPVNGCFSTAPVTVTQNRTAPSAGTISASSGFILTCYTNTTTLSCNAPQGNTFKWTNTNGEVLSETTSVTVSAVDTYTFTVTNPANGCTTSRSRGITQNRIAPVATLTPGSDITCSNPTVILTGTSSGSPVTYSWTGSGAITPLTTEARRATASVTTSGIYTLTLTTPAGCTGTASVTVNENKVFPKDVKATVNGDLCENISATLIGSSSTEGVRYQWTGPVESTDQTFETGMEGDYTLTVTDPANGCFVVTDPVTVEGCGETLTSARRATVMAETSEPVMVRVYPNPVRSIGTLEFTPQYDGPVLLELYTLTNVKVSAVQGGEAKAGQLSAITFDTEAYASGMYFYRLKVGSAEIKTGRIMIVH
jgi:hypothetical protein